MVELSLDLDDEVIRRARRFALARNVSLDDMVRDYLESVAATGVIDPAAAVARMRSNSAQTGRPPEPPSVPGDERDER